MVTVFLTIRTSHEKNYRLIRFSYVYLIIKTIADFGRQLLLSSNKTSTVAANQPLLIR